MVGLTVDDDFSHSFSLAHGIASRADVAPSIGNGDSTELQTFQGKKDSKKNSDTNLRIYYLQLTIIDKNCWWENSVQFEPVDSNGLITRSLAADVYLIAGSHNLALWFQPDPWWCCSKIIKI